MSTATMAVEPILVAVLAMTGEPIGKVKLLRYLASANIRAANGKAYTAETLVEAMNELKKEGWVKLASQGYFLSVKSKESHRVFQEALLKATQDGSWNALCNAYYKYNNFQKKWNGTFYVDSYAEALAGLRMALWSGKPPAEIQPWLKTALSHPQYAGLHPYIELCAQPFNPLLFELLHLETQQAIIAHFLSDTSDWHDKETLEAIRTWTEDFIRQCDGMTDLTLPLAMDQILCGRLEDAWVLLQDHHLFYRGMVELLRGNHPESLIHFEAAFKILRRESGIRNAIVDGLGGYLYVLALLRSSDPKHLKQADAYLIQTEKQGLSDLDGLIFKRLRFFQQVQAGLAKPEDAPKLDPRKPFTLLQLFACLSFYWMGASMEQQKPLLIKMYKTAKSTGMHWIAAQAAELLCRMGMPVYAKQAEILRERGGFDNLVNWFERQEAWQRQLSALINLNGNAEKNAVSTGQSRLIWLITYSKQGETSLEPREQKCDSRGQWSKGRPVALKRLQTEAGKWSYLTPQDVQVATKAIRSSSYYYGVEFEIDTKKALPMLIGHPAIFWEDAPDIRVDLLRGEPELIIKKQAGQLLISLYPAIQESTAILVHQETPTRLRVIQVTDEHRRMAAILGSRLTVPIEAEERVMQAIGVVAPMITVQSDIGGNTANIEQIEADSRLHALLLPNQQGLKMQLRVRPFGEAGTYYAPGQGAESVIAEIDGKSLQARRTLSAETETMNQVINTCSVLKDAEFTHEEWQVSEPDDCLELLLQLQDQGEQVRVSWPEGEKFRMAGPRFDASRFSMSIQGERDWFAVQGELQLDENRVLDLQKLLTLIRHSPGRFIALGDNEFLALTEEFHRRLADMAAFSETQGKTIKVHSLAAFALEDLTDGLDQLQTDQEWKQHLQRLKKLDDLKPEIPGTLQAELRDYQIDGFCWLSRLANWGVGACLADDMGLGKTVQMLALLLSRASGGPALVVAPTSVCTNWLSETPRFAPSLNPVLFGPGDREQILLNLKPLDVLITSYGLLQQEIERFKPIQWHTLILDEAQAIKNSQTLRSDAVMALSADFRVIATGTPLENHLGELWNLFRFINPGLLGSLKHFNERFAGPIERQQDTTVRHQLRRLIQPFILRRTKTQVLSELPSRTEILRKVDSSPEEAALYEALRRSAVERLDNMEGTPIGQRQIQILAEMMKLRRACCNPMLVAPELGLSSSKLAAFGELLEELLENRHKALVFSQFVDHLTLIRAYLEQKKVSYQYLDGATPMRERKKRVDAFQAGEGDVFLISLKAGGTGLNLTAADYVIHMDPWWNPAVEDQASDRAHRMGQQRPVTIYRLVVRNTIEEAIVKLHTHKRDLADSLLEGSDVSSRMSAQDMIALLQEELRL